MNQFSDTNNMVQAKKHDRRASDVLYRAIYGDRLRLSGTIRQLLLALDSVPVCAVLLSDMYGDKIIDILVSLCEELFEEKNERRFSITSPIHKQVRPSPIVWRGPYGRDMRYATYYEGTEWMFSRAVQFELLDIRNNQWLRFDTVEDMERHIVNHNKPTIDKRKNLI